MSELPHKTNRIYVFPRDPERLDATFLFYYLSYAFCQGKMQEIAGGTTRLHLTVAAVKRLPLLGILEQEIAVPAPSSSRRRRRGTTRPAVLGDIARVTTSKPKDLTLVNVLQRVCDPEGTNCGRPYIVMGTAPLHVRSAASRNPDWRRKADTAMLQGRIAFERMRRGAEEVTQDARRATRAAEQRLREQQLQMAFDRIRSAASRVVTRSRIVGVDSNRLAGQLAAEAREAFEASGYTIPLERLVDYMEDRAAAIAEEMYNLRMSVRRATGSPGPSFARARYPQEEGFRARFHVEGRPGERAPRGHDPSASFRGGRATAGAAWQASQQQAHREAEAQRQATDRARQEQGVSQLKAVLRQWGVTDADQRSKTPEALIKDLRRSSRQFHPDRFARDTEAQQDLMKVIFQAANDDLDMLLQFLKDPASIDFRYREAAEFSLLNSALEEVPEPQTKASEDRMLPGIT